MRRLSEQALPAARELAVPGRNGAEPSDGPGVPRPRGAFVGRERELGELRAALDAAAGGRGHLYMVVGEPGIGKTRLADELATHAAARGATVLWGRCCEGGGAPAYWPWIQAIRVYLRGAEPEALAAQLGAGAAHVAQMVPELRAMLPGLPQALAEPAVDPDRARFHLFYATATFLRNAAVARPLLLVLDDLHAADRPSLLLLELVARELRDAPILALCCYRDVEVRREPEIAAVLAEVGRHARRLPLRGLSEANVATFMERAVGRSPTQALVAAVHRATEGNPFFLDEVVRLLAAEGRLSPADGLLPDRLGIPDGVRDAIRRRLTPLPPDSVDLLALAAVIGREFDLAGLERAAGGRSGEVVAALGEAVAAGIVHEVPGSLGRYAFSHGLIRETLYQDVPPAQRLDLHRRVGVALEEIHGADRDPHLAELAHHFYAAAPAGEAARALDYCVRAAERACRLLACEEAVAYYERALQTLAFVDAGEVRRCELLLALGEAQDLAGNIEVAKGTLRRAAHIARQLGLPELLARAALGAGGQWAAKFTASPFDKCDVALLEEALAALDARDGPLRAKLLGRLALTLSLAGRGEQGQLLVREAVEMARRLGDAATLGHALRASHGVLLGPEHLEARLRVSAELAQLATETGSRELALRGHALRMLDLLEAAEVEQAEIELDAHSRLAEAIRDPFDLWLSTVQRATWAQMRGRWEESEALTQEASDIAGRLAGQQAAEENAGLCLTVQTFFNRRERGDLEALEPALRHFAARWVLVPGVRAVLTAFYAELGRLDDARREFERLASNDFASIPRDVTWLGVMQLLSDACVALDDVARAGVLYGLLLPYAGRVAVVASPGCSGALARSLGRLATLREGWGDAARHFEAALALNERLGARPWIAHTLHDHACMLRARGGPGDGERAHDLLERAAAAARDLGLERLAMRVAARLSGGGSSGEATTTDAARSASNGGDQCAFRREGDYWTVVYDGATLRLRHAKGLAYLALLLRHPGREIHAADVAALAAGAPGDAWEGGVVHPPPASGETVIDARARAAYRRRLDELSTEIEDARANQDLGRAERARAEVEFLTQELERAMGLGGRGRRTGSAAERARLNVTRALRAALGRLAARHPQLGRHLHRTVRTGTFCSYSPDPRVPIAWQA